MKRDQKAIPLTSTLHRHSTSTKGPIIIISIDATTMFIRCLSWIEFHDRSSKKPIFLLSRHGIPRRFLELSRGPSARIWPSCPPMKASWLCDGFVSDDAVDIAVPLANSTAPRDWFFFGELIMYDLKDNTAWSRGPSSEPVCTCSPIQLGASTLTYG